MQKFKRFFSSLVLALSILLLFPVFLTQISTYLMRSNYFNTFIFKSNFAISSPLHHNVSTSHQITELKKNINDLTIQLQNLKNDVLYLQKHITLLEDKKADGSPFISQNLAIYDHSLINHSFKKINNDLAYIDEFTQSNTKTHPHEASKTLENFRALHKENNNNAMSNNDRTEHEVSITDVNQDKMQIIEPEKMFAIGYNYILSGNYQKAEDVFRKFIKQFPKDKKIANVTFWLGESLYAQKRYQEAVQLYLYIDENFTTQLHNPENLYKLSLAFAHTDDPAQACLTLVKLKKIYKKLTPAMLRHIQSEEKRLNCTQQVSNDKKLHKLND